MFRIRSSHMLPSRMKKLALIQKNKLHEMKFKYPHILEKTFYGKIAYTLQWQSPKETIAKGGFLSSSHLWLSNTGSGNNLGCICFSLLPEVAALFSRGSVPKSPFTSQKSLYLYALPLTGNFILPGSAWREVISPGAFPLPPFWLARELLNIDYKRNIILGELMTGANKINVVPGERMQAYLNNTLILPEELDFGEDFPLSYRVIDTEASASMQHDVEAYYYQTQRHKIFISG